MEFAEARPTDVQTSSLKSQLSVSLYVRVCIDFADLTGSRVDNEVFSSIWSCLENDMESGSLLLSTGNTQDERKIWPVTCASLYFTAEVK